MLISYKNTIISLHVFPPQITEVLCIPGNVLRFRAKAVGDLSIDQVQKEAEKQCRDGMDLEEHTCVQESEIVPEILEEDSDQFVTGNVADSLENGRHLSIMVCLSVNVSHQCMLIGT